MAGTAAGASAMASTAMRQAAQWSGWLAPPGACGAEPSDSCTAPVTPETLHRSAQMLESALAVKACVIVGNSTNVSIASTASQQLRRSWVDLKLITGQV